MKIIITETQLKNILINDEIRKKEKIGSGKDHYVYDYEGDPTKVIKVAWDAEDGNKFNPKSKIVQVNINKNHIDIFKKYPDFFPKVHKVTNRYAIIDKLDTKQIKNDEIELYRILSTIGFDDFEYITEKTAISTAYWNFANKKGLFEKVLKKLSSNGILDESAVVKKYMNFFYKILKSSLKKKLVRLDIIGDNIGYDKDGELKLLDF